MDNKPLSSLLRQLDLGLRRRVPVVHQTESSECGLACLAMVCGHYGKSLDMMTLRQQFNLSARGTSLEGLSGIAAGLGMRTRALSLDLDEMTVGDLSSMASGLSWDEKYYSPFSIVTRA